MKSVRNIILVTVAILVGLVGCGSGGDDWIVGVWEVDQIVGDGTSTLKFSSDGTVVVNEGSKDKSPVPYSLSGDILTIEDTKSDGTTKQMKMKIDSHNEQSFVATMIGFPITMEYRRVK